jgi:hypothetical protein
MERGHPDLSPDLSTGFVDKYRKIWFLTGLTGCNHKTSCRFAQMVCIQPLIDRDGRRD